MRRTALLSALVLWYYLHHTTTQARTTLFCSDTFAAARTKLCVEVGAGDCVLVLEQDGTEVDEEEYFQLLPPNTVLMLLPPGREWSRRGVTTWPGPPPGLAPPPALLAAQLAHRLELHRRLQQGSNHRNRRDIIS